MNLSPHFKLSELLNSITASVSSIDNTTNDPVIIKALTNLCNISLEQIRAILKHPMIITSGYRCPELNDIVSKNPNSQHMKGEAVDFVASIADMKLLEKEAENKTFEFDQLIIYPKRGFIHVSYTTRKPNRYQILFR